MADADDEGVTVFVQRLHLVLEQRHLRDAMAVLNDETRDGELAAAGGNPLALPMLHFVRGRLNASVLALQGAGAGNDDDDDDDRQILQRLRPLAVQAIQEVLRVWEEIMSEEEEEGDDDGVPAQAAAGATAAAACSSLERQTFCRRDTAGGEDDDDDGGVAVCSICLVEFVDGGEVSVMPCPSRRRHKFHPDCIARWLEMRNTCPLCRHQRPTAADAYT